MSELWEEDGGGGDETLGERIDTALGRFEEKLAGLREELEIRKATISDLESEIAAVEKQQAKAFKDLLSGNSEIKKLLNPRRTKGRKGRAAASSSRKKPAKVADDTPADDRPQKPFGGPRSPWQGN